MKESNRILKTILHDSYKKNLNTYSNFFKQLEKKWNIIAPAASDTLIFLRPLICLSGNDLFGELKKYSYVAKGGNGLLTKMENKCLFNPSDTKDYLATSIATIMRDERGENAIRLIICYSDSVSPGKNCILTVQGNKSYPIYSMPCYVSDKTRPPNRCHIRYVSIPENTDNLRVCIHSDDVNPTFIPEAIILEHRVLLYDKKDKVNNS